MNAEEMRRCWQLRNSQDDLVLHHMSRSQASGFARYLLGLQVKNTSGPYNDVLRLRPPSMDARMTYRMVDDAVSADDLVAVLKIGREVM